MLALERRSGYFYKLLNVKRKYNVSLALAVVAMFLNPIILSVFAPTGTDGYYNDNDSRTNNRSQDLDSLLYNSPDPTPDQLPLSEVLNLGPSGGAANFTYPKYSGILPLGNAQNTNQLRNAYKSITNRGGGIQLAMAPFTVDNITYPAGTILSLGGISGNFNSTYSKSSFNITKAYALHSRRIVVFKSELQDAYGQNLTWEEGYFERIFRVYLWGNNFDTINETGIRDGDLMDYDFFIVPSVIKGYEKTMTKKIGPKGFSRLRNFIKNGNFMYAQGGSCFLAQEAKLIPKKTVWLDQRLKANNSHADMTIVNSSSIMSHNWRSNQMYVIDDPVFNNTESSAVVAKYTGNLTNSSLLNSPAIMTFEYKNGQVILVNGHPSVNNEFYPIVFNALFSAKAEPAELTASARQIYAEDVAYNLIPAQEPNVTVQVNVEYYNFWPVATTGPRKVQLYETVSPLFRVDQGNITPKPSNITTNSNNETIIKWVFNDTQGITKFMFHVKTYSNTTKKGVALVCTGYARYTPPGYRGKTEIHHGGVSIYASLAARLNGDRDIELDGCYPLPASGFYYDIALPLENKEETTAENITIMDIVCLKSPIVDVQNQSRVPGAWNNTNNGTNNITFAVNEIFYYYDENNKPLYPLPDEIHNTTYTYQFGNGTNITLPAKKLIWYYPDLVAYDYVEPAIRYGIFTHEEHNRTVSFLSDPVNGSVILNASGGSVFTNIGIHPVPYHEYLQHGVVTIPKAAGNETSNVTYKDIWHRNHTMDLRTVFYDIVPFPPPEEHMVVTTTFEMTYNGERLKEFPIHHEVDLRFKLKTWNGYSKYDPNNYPYKMNITKNETMIVQAIPKGVGYNIAYINSTYNQNTSLLMIENTSMYTILYFQQDIEGGHKEVIDINTTLSAYPSYHREGRMKVNDGARFVYHQIAVGPSRYEVFDSHVQAVFAIGNDVQVKKKVAPVYIATFGDDVYHFIELEDPYEPREFMEDPYIKSHGFGDMAATTFVGGRINETLYHSRVNPGGRTLMRLEVDNNLGYDLENVSIIPVAPEGFNVTPDNFTTKIPPIFYDFPFINRTEIWDAWKSVYYYWVDINSSVEGGRIYQINFTFISNCSNASYIPADFEIPPAVIGVKDGCGSVKAIFGRAVNVTLSDMVPSFVRPEDVRIANDDEKSALELMLAVGISSPGDYNRSIVNQSYQTLRGTNFTSTTGGKINVILPPYAQMLPWKDNNTDKRTLFVIIRTNVSVNSGGTYTVNNGPTVSYKNHFNETVNITGESEYIEAHGPAFNYRMMVLNINSENEDKSYLMGGINNTVRAKVSIYNYGDGIAESSTVAVNLPPGVLLDTGSLPTNAYASTNGKNIYWTIGDLGPGSEDALEFEFFTTPPEINLTQNRGPPEPWLLIESARAKFTHGYLKKVVSAPASGALHGYLFDSDLAVTKIYYSHPFAATNHTHTIYAAVKNDWPFSDIINDIKINFSVNDIYIGNGSITQLVPGDTGSCSIDYIFNQEGIYNIKATIAEPVLNEFYDTNNEFEGTLTVVDPVTINSEPDLYTGTDGFIASLDPQLTFGDQHKLKVGRVSSAGGYGSGIGVVRSYVEFDTSGVPKDALVLDAELKLYMYKSVGGDLKISSYQVLSSWAEDNTTWNSPPNFNGACLDSPTVDSAFGYKSWDVTDAVHGWVANPATNYGILLRSDQETWYWSKEFYSSDTENGLRPMLVIHYAMLKNTPEITTTVLSVSDHQDSEVRLEWSPVPYSLYYEVYRANTISGPYTILGATWNPLDPYASENGSLNTFFYDDIDGGYPEAPTVISTDRANLPGTIRVSWSAPAAPTPSAVYYYRVMAIGVEERKSKLTDSPTIAGQVTPEIVKYQVYNSTTASGPWDNNHYLGEAASASYIHGGLGQGKLMYYKIRSVSSEGYESVLSKYVWGRSNRAPTTTSPYIDPTEAYTSDYLYAEYTFFDPDGDPDSGSTFKWYRNGAPLSWNRYYIYPSWTAKDQVWYFTVTPKDGIEFGAPATSGMLTIKNSAPILSDVRILPSSPVTTENLTLSYTFNDADFDPETGTRILWFKDGLHQAAYNGKTSIPASATVKNQLWNASIITGDGTISSIWYHTAQLKVLNSKPVAADLKITPASPATTDALNAIYSYSDTDNDPESGSTIQWYKDDQLQNTYKNLLKLPAAATGKAEVWHFTVTPNDGEDGGIVVESPAVKIENTVPEIVDAKLYPEVPTTIDHLWIQYDFNDPDGDLEIGSLIRWYCNDEHRVSLDNVNLVPAAETTRGEQWKYSIIPKDGFEFGDIFYSNTVIINNSAPIVATTDITPARPAVADSLTISYTYMDPDGDTVTEAKIRWFKNNLEQPELMNSEKVPSKYTDSGDVWYFELQVSDGFAFGPVHCSIEVLINNPPSASNVHITPDTPTTPTTLDTLSVNYVWSDVDPDDEEQGTMIQWFRNGKPIGSLTNSLFVPAEKTSKGEQWYCMVTPADGMDPGLGTRSETVVIKNTAPQASEPMIIPAAPTNTDELTANYQYFDLDSDHELGSVVKWYKNSVLVDELDNGHIVPSNMLKSGDNWYFTLEPCDGDDLGESVASRIVIIGNAIPVITHASIIPEQPSTIEPLEANVEVLEIDSANNDDQQFEYVWYQNEILQSRLNDWNTVPAGMTAKGDEWYYTARIFDGISWSAPVNSQTVIIQNTAPEIKDISISVSTSTNEQMPINTIDQPLELSYTYFDVDGDPEAGNEIRWYRNGELIANLNDDGEVPADMLESGDDWHCTLRPNDGSEFGEIVSASTITIRLNLIPMVKNVVITQTDAGSKLMPGTALSLTYEYHDDDNDLEGDTLIQWYRDGMHVTEFDGQKSVPGDSVMADEQWYVIVTPHDGNELGSQYRSNEIYIPVTRSEVSSVDRAEIIDYVLTFVFLICAFILIIYIIGFLFIRLKAKKEHAIRVGTPDEELALELDLELPDDDPVMDRDEEYEQVTQELGTIKTEVIPVSVPLRLVLQNLELKEFDMGEQEQGLELDDDHEADAALSDDFEVVFVCDKCDSEIETDLEICPNCGEKFGAVA